MAINKYQLLKDASGHYNGDVLDPSRYIDCYVLSASAATYITIPTGAKFAVFNSTNNFYVSWATSATVPSINITNGNGSELNPVSRYVEQYARFSIISPTECVITISYFN